MEGSLKILITEPSDFSPKALEQLSSRGEVSIGPLDRQELLQSIKKYSVVILRLGHQFDNEMLEAAKNLKYILTPTTGLNHIDISEAEKRGIEIISLKGEIEFLDSIPSTAEHTWALLLSLVRMVPQAHQHVINGGWNREKFKSRNLSALKLGILGYGRVGKQVAKFAEAFGLNYSYYDVDPQKTGKNAVETLEELLQQADVLSIHIPLNVENENFLNSKNLTHLKVGAYIINTSRGEVMEEKFLVQMLKEGKIQGIATDVIGGELNTKTRRENPLLQYAKNHENVIITPHIAGATYESMHLTEEFVVNKWLNRL